MRRRVSSRASQRAVFSSSSTSSSRIADFISITSTGETLEVDKEIRSSPLDVRYRCAPHMDEDRAVNQFVGVKVFSATMQLDRDRLGDQASSSGWPSIPSGRRRLQHHTIERQRLSLPVESSYSYRTRWREISSKRRRCPAALFGGRPGQERIAMKKALGCFSPSLDCSSSRAPHTDAARRARNSDVSNTHRGDSEVLEAPIPGLRPLLDESVAYVVFPAVGEGGFSSAAAPEAACSSSTARSTGFAEVSHVRSVPWPAGSAMRSSSSSKIRPRSRISSRPSRRRRQGPGGPAAQRAIFHAHDVRQGRHAVFIKTRSVAAW